VSGQIRKGSLYGGVSRVERSHLEKRTRRKKKKEEELPTHCQCICGCKKKLNYDSRTRGRCSMCNSIEHIWRHAKQRPVG